MPSTPTTPLSNVEWGEFQDFISSQIQLVLDKLDEIFNTYTGNYPSNSQQNIQRLRYIQETNASGQAPMSLFTQAIFEYMTKTDLNGDGKIFGHDFVWEQPQPALEGVTLAAKQRNPNIEVVPGEPPPDLIYNG